MKNKNTIGIIVARLQIDTLTAGHAKLIYHSLKNNDCTIVFLCTTKSRLTYTNPLSFDARRALIADAFTFEQFNAMKILPIQDCKNDRQWDKNLDAIIDKTFPAKNKKITIYGGRDGITTTYKGKFATKKLNFGINDISATMQREIIYEKDYGNKHWRAGVIWASAHKYPVSYQTTDVAVVRDALPKNWKKNTVNVYHKQVLLVKKPGELKYRFPGGFVDVDDASLETAAKREVTEELGLIETDNYQYIGSFRIDDWRYRKEKDKILTAFFCCNYIFGVVQLQDDLKGGAYKWVKVKDLAPGLVEPEHKPLMQALIKHLVNK